MKAEKRVMSKGFTLIEAIMAIVIIAIAFYALISIFFTVVPKIIDAEALAIATHLAEEKIEELMVKDFSGITSVSATSFGGDFSNYYYQIIVNYVSSEELDTVVDPTVTDYKRVKAQVWSNLAGTLEIVTLSTSWEVE